MRESGSEQELANLNAALSNGSFGGGTLVYEAAHV
jgi:hypothetical protein